MKKAASLADKQANGGPMGTKKKKRKLSLLQTTGSGGGTIENSIEATTPPDGTSPAKIAKKEGSTEEQKPATATVIPGLKTVEAVQ